MQDLRLWISLETGANNLIISSETWQPWAAAKLQTT